MKKTNRLLSLFLAGSMLLTAGCGRSTTSPAERPVPAETETIDHTAGPFSPDTGTSGADGRMLRRAVGYNQ